MATINLIIRKAIMATFDMIIIKESVRAPQQYAPHRKSSQVGVFASGDVVDYWKVHDNHYLLKEIKVAIILTIMMTMTIFFEQSLGSTCDLMHVQDQPWQVADDEDGDDQH